MPLLTPYLSINFLSLLTDYEFLSSFLLIDKLFSSKTIIIMRLGLTSPSSSPSSWIIFSTQSKSYGLVFKIGLSTEHWTRKILLLLQKKYFPACVLHLNSESEEEKKKITTAIFDLWLIRIWLEYLALSFLNLYSKLFNLSGHNISQL